MHDVTIGNKGAAAIFKNVFGTNIVLMQVQVLAFHNFTRLSSPTEANSVPVTSNATDLIASA